MARQGWYHLSPGRIGMKWIESSWAAFSQCKQELYPVEMDSGGHKPGEDPDPTIDPPGGFEDPSTGSSAFEDLVEIPIGESIGPFKLLDKLGEGGFGVVYLAEQSSPVKRRVALKLIKAGMDTKAVIARFEAERQALAIMDHPGIARVYEAGVTEAGRPYFVMEHVQGEPISTYCDRHRLTTEERLELFKKVCDAVQHAHTKGIIHRDLKPSNILVSVNQSDVPQSKIIDFGIAKATSQQLSEHTVYTQQGQLIGTPEYMSPEQAEMTNVDIDTRTDIYSLGIILYELLAGKLPFDGGSLRLAPMNEIQRIIREQDPPRPSTRLSSLDNIDASTIAASRRSRIGELTSKLRKELEWIPLKAIRKNRTERYETAKALGDDVERYLRGEALEAGPESRLYRFSKAVRRNKGPVTAAALIVLVLVAGIVGMAIIANYAAEQAAIASKNAHTATINMELAQRRSDQLQAVADFQAKQLAEIDVSTMGASLRRRILQDMGIQPSVAAGMDFAGAALELLDEQVFTRTYSAINEQFEDQPLVRAQLLDSLGVTLIGVGLLEDAEQPLETAVQLRREWLGDEHEDTIRSIGNMGKLLIEQGRLEEAATYCSKALENARSVLGDQDPVTLEAINDMGLVLVYQGRFDEALPYWTDAMEGRRKVLGDRHPETLISIHNMGGLLHATGMYEQARDQFMEVLNVRRELLGDDHADTLISIGSVGSLLASMGLFDEARALQLEALQTSRRTLGNEHPYTLTAINNMGNMLTDQGLFEEAMPYYSEALETRRRVLGDEHPSTLNSINNMGYLLNALDRHDEALPYYTEALSTSRRVLGAEHPDTLGSINNMGILWYSKGEYEKAVDFFMQALEARRRTLGDDHPHTLNSINNIGAVLFKLNRFQDALPYHELMFETTSRSMGVDDPRTLESLEGLIRLHDAWHEAEPEAGHDAKAAEYRAQLERARPKVDAATGAGAP